VRGSRLIPAPASIWNALNTAFQNTKARRLAGFCIFRMPF
jgi:hypothetical protein